MGPKKKTTARVRKAVDIEKSMRKSTVPLTVFAESSECPFTAKALRIRINQAKGITDSKGKTRIPAPDPALLRCVLQPTPKGPLFIDRAAFAGWLDAQRLEHGDAA